MKRHVFMFQPRFAPLVESGEKIHTIRGLRKRPVSVGDVLDMREWTGKPYRSKQRKLREEICTSVLPIRLENLDWHARLGINWISYAQFEALAISDGFNDAADMRSWFRETHGLPFEGVLTSWKPSSVVMEKGQS